MVGLGLRGARTDPVLPAGAGGGRPGHHNPRGAQAAGGESGPRGHGGVLLGRVVLGAHPGGSRCSGQPPEGKASSWCSVVSGLSESMQTLV